MVGISRWLAAISLAYATLLHAAPIGPQAGQTRVTGRVSATATNTSVAKTIVQSKPSRATFLKAMQAKFHKLDTDHDNLLTWGLPGAPETLGAVADC